MKCKGKCEDKGKIKEGKCWGKVKVKEGKGNENGKGMVRVNVKIKVKFRTKNGFYMLFVATISF